MSFEFAKEFYTKISRGFSVGCALRLSRKNLAEKHGIETVAWASYILYGDPGFVLLKPKPAALKVSSKKIKLTKKKTLLLCLSSIVIALGLFLYNFLPTLNPNTYILFSRARNYYLEGANQQVVEIAQDIIEDESLFLPAYELLGDVYFRLGDQKTALQYYSDYLRFSDKKNDNKNLAKAYIKIAWLYHMKGDYQKAKDFYNSAIQLARKYNDKLNEADALSRLAVWHIDKGDIDQAFALLMQSSEINRNNPRNMEHRFNLACDYFNTAFIFMEKDDYKAAKEFYTKSFKIFQELKEIPELSDYYFNRGEIALYEKKYQEALDYYDKGLELDQKLNHRFNLSSDYQMIAELYWEMGRFAEAEKNFREAISLSKEIANLPILASVYYDLGMMYKEMGEKKKAKGFLAQALDLYKNIDTPDYQEVYQDYLALE